MHCYTSSFTCSARERSRKQCGLGLELLCAGTWRKKVGSARRRAGLLYLSVRPGVMLAAVAEGTHLERGVQLSTHLERGWKLLLGLCDI